MSTHSSICLRLQAGLTCVDLQDVAVDDPFDIEVFHNTPTSPSKFGVHATVDHKHVFLGWFEDRGLAHSVVGISERSLRAMTASNLVPTSHRVHGHSGLLVAASGHFSDAEPEPAIAVDPCPTHWSPGLPLCSFNGRQSDLTTPDPDF